MTRTRTTHVLITAAPCAAGVVVLHLIGLPLPAAIMIGVLALAATLFTSWANTLRPRPRDDEPPR